MKSGCGDARKEGRDGSDIDISDGRPLFLVGKEGWQGLRGCVSLIPIYKMIFAHLSPNDFSSSPTAFISIPRSKNSESNMNLKHSSSSSSQSNRSVCHDLSKSSYMPRSSRASSPAILVYPYRHQVNSWSTIDELTHFQAIFPSAHSAKIECVLLMIEGLAEL